VTFGIELYRSQHADLLRAVAALQADLANGVLAAEVARGHLAQLSGKLTVHLQMEDRSLYPAFLGSGAPEVREVARRFQWEMGDLRNAAGAFWHRWLAPDAIAGDPEVFRIDGLALLDKLDQRIRSEDAQLYPLAERFG
jgi:hypothetical protein